MTRCHQCMDISSYDTEPCPNEPPCKSVSICNFPVTHCDHKEQARVESMAEHSWADTYDQIATDLGISWDDWCDASDEEREAIIVEASHKTVFKLGYLSGFEQGRAERR